jgi:molybdate transport system substrate-binding protein
VTTIDIPDQFNVVAKYPVAIVKGGSNPDGARAFIDYLLSPAGQAVLRTYGFLPARTS